MSIDDDKASVKTLYTQCTDIENELKKEFKRTNPNQSRIQRARERLKANYEKIMFVDYDFAVAKDIEVALWKSCFYKVIEDFRMNIRQLVQSKEKRNISTLCSQFRAFLETACLFYHNLIEKLKEKFELPDGPIPESVRTNQQSFRPYVSCHRSLIYLGDLTRYHRDLYNDPKQSSWIQAETYYKRALQLWPENGHPLNQLAVICTYKDDEFNTVYYYFRSLEVKIPFSTAQDNLQVLFEKIVSAQNGQKSARAKSNQPREVLTFLQKFVQLHAILWTCKGLEKFDSLRSSVMQMLEQLMEKELAKEVIVLRLFVTCIAHIDFISKHTGTGKESKALPFAMTLAFDCFTRVLKNFLTRKHESNGSSRTNFYISLSIFCAWLISHSDYLRKPYRHSSDVWEAMRQYVAGAANQVLQTTNSDTASTTQTSAPLKEERELQGFLPLSDALAEINFSLPTLQEGPESELRRKSKIIQFALVASDVEWITGENFVSQKDGQFYVAGSSLNPATKSEQPSSRNSLEFPESPEQEDGEKEINEEAEGLTSEELLDDDNNNDNFVSSTNGSGNLPDDDEELAGDVILFNKSSKTSEPLVVPDEKEVLSYENNPLFKPKPKAPQEQPLQPPQVSVQQGWVTGPTVSNGSRTSAFPSPPASFIPLGSSADNFSSTDFSFPFSETSSNSLWSGSDPLYSIWDNGNKTKNLTKSQQKPRQQDKRSLAAVGSGRDDLGRWSLPNPILQNSTNDDIDNGNSSVPSNLESFIPNFGDEADDAPPGFGATTTPSTTPAKVTPLAGGRAVYPPPNSSVTSMTETFINAPFASSSFSFLPPGTGGPAWGFSKQKQNNSFEPFSAYQPAVNQQSNSYGNFPYQNAAVPPSFVHKDG